MAKTRGDLFVVKLVPKPKLEQLKKSLPSPKTCICDQERNMASSVRVKEASVVTPSEPNSSNVLALSALDSQLFLRFTIEYLLVYKPCPGLDQV
ncbi:hypothetical protein VNO78_15797 [Psophocarpus tetragonolobus]|uniref:Uncharacterized protein n=1 Tax=Psophocarpus tetragonolobus TaxID=3891 RepID=A0AAN9XJH3_PSOTE